MEDNKNRNYDQENRDYNDAPATTDFEKSKLNNDPNQAYQKNPEQFEEFSDDYPNRNINNNTNTNSGSIDEDKWKENDLNRNIDDRSNISNPDDDFEGESLVDDRDLDSDLDEEDEEDDFDESDIDDEDDEKDYDDEINNENSDLDDDWGNRKN